MMDNILKTEYSETFDKIRKDMVQTSYYKYGPARKNFDGHHVDPIVALKRCLAKAEETKNTEYLADVANYAMFAFMFPKEGWKYTPTDSSGSAGTGGMSVNEVQRFKDQMYYEDRRNF
jgi:hypothetical protein